MSEYHFSLMAICNECMKRVGELKYEGTHMSNFSRVNNVFLFKCPKCNRVIKCSVKEEQSK